MIVHLFSLVEFLEDEDTTVTQTAPSLVEALEGQHMVALLFPTCLLYNFN